MHVELVLLAICDEWPRAMRLAVEAIAEEYGCDTCDFAILEGAAREHGQLVTEDMMPEAEAGLTMDAAMVTIGAWAKQMAATMQSSANAANASGLWQITTSARGARR